jgi:small subunit ribosomal protein S8
MTTDPIADMLTRIRNGLSAKKTVLDMPYSKIKEQIAGILKANGYLAGVEVVENGAFKALRLELQDPSTKEITSLIRMSKPGRRVYAKRDEIPRVLGGHGLVIISTSAGIMSGREARQKGLGGELICKVW